MVRCRTELDDNVMKALTNYHIKNNYVIKRRKNLYHLLGIVLIGLSIYSAYTSWKEYAGTESIFIILAMPLVYAVLSAGVFLAADKGVKNSLYKELKKYFEKTNITHFDYVISENGIRISINGNATTYKWDMVDKYESDDQYYYFGSEEKYNIIAKKGISSKNIETLEELFKNVNIK